MAKEPLVKRYSSLNVERDRLALERYGVAGDGREVMVP